MPCRGMSVVILTLPIFNIEPRRRSQQFQLTGGLEIGILLGRWLLGRSHRLPHRVRIAVRLIDAIVLAAGHDSLLLELPSTVTEPLHRVGGDVVVVIVPQQHRSLSIGLGCHRIDIRRLAYA